MLANFAKQNFTRHIEVTRKLLDSELRGKVRLFSEAKTEAATKEAAHTVLMGVGTSEISMFPLVHVAPPQI